MSDHLARSIETNIAYAHRSILYAVDSASMMSELGYHDDLQLVLLELERIQVDLLRGGKRRRKSLIDCAYLSSSGPDDRRPAA